MKDHGIYDVQKIYNMNVNRYVIPKYLPEEIAAHQREADRNKQINDGFEKIRILSELLTFPEFIAYIKRIVSNSEDLYQIKTILDEGIDMNRHSSLN